jgi:hypothetical protein
VFRVLVVPSRAPQPRTELCLLQQREQQLPRRVTRRDSAGAREGKEYGSILWIAIVYNTSVMQQ